MTMTPLKTLKGSKIWYSKFGVGKQIGSKIYFHITVWDKIVPEDIWNKALKVLESYKMPLEAFSTVCYDFKQPNIIRFDTCPGFNYQDEPMVGSMKFIDVEQGVIIKEKTNYQIFHHKWLWVMPDYKGFDVEESYEWSKLWLGKLPEVASGRVYLWEEQLKKYNII